MFRTACAHRRIPRRCNAKTYSTQHCQTTSQDLRALLRETAQPVAVVTSFMPSSASSSPKYHGATLSSFTSIAMDPHPLVAFSLRMPSRMGASLKAAQPHLSSHMVINILSAAQEITAVQFSRPDLYPEPFSSASHWLNKEGLPVLVGSLGALSCKLVSASWPLHDLASLENNGELVPQEKCAVESSGVTSELFIARVTRVERIKPVDEGGDHLRTLPLLYHRQRYATASHIPHTKSSSLPQT